MTLKRLRTDFSTDTQQWATQYKGVDAVVPVMDIEERLRIVEERLLILEPLLDKFSKYPALAEAYKEYKLIEKLTLGNNEA